MFPLLPAKYKDNDNDNDNNNDNDNDNDNKNDNDNDNNTALPSHLCVLEGASAHNGLGKAFGLGVALSVRAGCLWQPCIR